MIGSDDAFKAARGSRAACTQVLKERTIEFISLDSARSMLNAMKCLKPLHRVEHACYISLNALWVIPNNNTRPSRSPLNGKRIAGPNWFESTPARATERGYSPNELNISRPMTRPIRWRGMANWIAVKSRTMILLLAMPPISIQAMAPMTLQVGRSAIAAATITPSYSCKF